MWSNQPSLGFTSPASYPCQNSLWGASDNFQNGKWAHSFTPVCPQYNEISLLTQALCRSKSSSIPHLTRSRSVIWCQHFIQLLVKQQRCFSIVNISTLRPFHYAWKQQKHYWDTRVMHKWISNKQCPTKNLRWKMYLVGKGIIKPGLWVCLGLRMWKKCFQRHMWVN